MIKTQSDDQQVDQVDLIFSVIIAVIIRWTLGDHPTCDLDRRPLIT
ncbi:hypothetical protein [Streptomyces sp. NPDC086989]